MWGDEKAPSGRKPATPARRLTAIAFLRAEPQPAQAPGRWERAGRSERGWRGGGFQPDAFVPRDGGHGGRRGLRGNEAAADGARGPAMFSRAFRVRSNTAIKGSDR